MQQAPTLSAACTQATLGRIPLQDMVVLWSVFCAISFVQTLQHLTRRSRGVSGPPTDASMLASLSLSQHLPALRLATQQR